jgi:hypothetical protein
MKTALQLLTELLHDACPPRGCAIVLTEEADATPNWSGEIRLVSLDVLSRYNDKCGELRKSDPQIDWSCVTEQVNGQRRIARWLSEVALVGHHGRKHGRYALAGKSGP